jgi:hypothetical protein
MSQPTQIPSYELALSLVADLCIPAAPTVLSVSVVHSLVASLFGVEASALAEDVRKIVDAHEEAYERHLRELEPGAGDDNALEQEF